MAFQFYDSIKILYDKSSLTLCLTCFSAVKNTKSLITLVYSGYGWKAVKYPSLECSTRKNLTKLERASGSQPAYFD